MKLHFPIKHLKLRTKLNILLVETAVVPLLFVILLVTVRLQNTERQAAAALATQIGTNASTEISSFINSQYGILDDIGRIYETADISAAAQTEQKDHLLERFLYGSTYFQDLTLLDASGHEILRENRAHVFGPSDLVSRAATPQFQTVKRDGYYLGPEQLVDGRSTVVLGRAIHNLDGTFLGATFVVVDARVFQDVIEAAAASHTNTSVYVVDSNTTILAHPDFSEVLRQTTANYLPPTILASSTSIHEYKNEQGVDVIGTAAPVNLTLPEVPSVPTNWFVITEQKSSVALASVAELTQFALFIMALAAIIVTIISLFSSAQIVKPLEEIHSVAKDYGAGRFERRVAVSANDEIGDLARGFNVMADKISSSISALRRDRQRVSSIIQNLSDGLIEHAADNTVLLINPVAAALLGVNEEAVLNKKFQPLEQLPTGVESGDDALRTVFGLSYHDHITLANEELAQPHSDVKEALFEIIGAQRRYLVVTSLSYVLVEDGKEEKRYLKIIHDATREQIISRMKSEFISIAAHQLRTPLTEMKWAMRAVLDGDAGKLTVLQEKLIGNSYRTNESMVRLVSDLLNVSRIEEGRFGYSFVEGNLVAFVSSILENFKGKFTEKNITLLYEPPTLPNAFFDEEKLSLALNNVLDNAFNYSEAGSTVRVALRQEDKYIRVEIEDHGIGIPKEDLSRIFGKFYRAANAIRLQTQGSGLGLFIVKNIVEAHGGSISIMSEQGKGTEVSFTIPLSRELIPAQNLLRNFQAFVSNVNSPIS
jgi:signal transduction histidine kinase